MLLKIAKSVKIVIILRKTAILPKLLDFVQKHYSVFTFAHINLPKKGFFYKLVRLSIKYSVYDNLQCIFSYKAIFLKLIFEQNCENTTAKKAKHKEKGEFLV